MRVVGLTSWVVVMAWSTLAAAAPCSEAISEATTQKVFDALAPAKPSDGCVLEAVKTDKAEMSITWKKGDALLEPLLVLPSGCAKSATPGSHLTAIVPKSLEGECPAAILATRAVVEAPSIGDLVQVTKPVAIPDGYASPLVRYRLAIVAGGAALVLALVAPALWLARRRRRAAADAGRGGEPPAESPKG